MKKFSIKKFLLPVFVFFLAAGVLCAQSTDTNAMQTTMDSAVKGLAAELSGKLAEEKAGKIVLGEFIYAGTISPLGQYWVNQLSEELTNIRSRSFDILVNGSADLIISGEIVELSDTVRVFTRLVRSADRAVRAAFHSDFERNEHVFQMLSTYDGRGSRRSLVPRDAWEPDSWDNPVAYEIGLDENVPLMNRTIHTASGGYDVSGGDAGTEEDFFLLLPANSGRLVMETTGNTDTYMEFYNADTRENLASNDDGGSGSNARIRYNVEAGKRYIVKLRGYGSDDTGSYGFRAYYQARTAFQPDEYESDDDPSSARLISIGTPQQHTFHDGDDVDYVKFQVTQRGRYILRARGANSNRLDTYMELYNESLNLIGEDDDGGASYDSRLSLTLDPGLYYLKIRCLDEDPDQPYIVSIDIE